MQTAKLFQRLKSAESALRATGVTSLRLFKLHDRGAAKPASDIYLYAHGEAGVRLDLVRIAQGHALLQPLFPDIEIKYSSKESIVPIYLPEIEANSICVF